MQLLNNISKLDTQIYWQQFSIVGLSKADIAHHLHVSCVRRGILQYMQNKLPKIQYFWRKYDEYDVAQTNLRSILSFSFMRNLRFNISSVIIPRAHLCVTPVIGHKHARLALRALNNSRHSKPFYELRLPIQTSSAFKTPNIKIKLETKIVLLLKLFNRTRTRNNLPLLQLRHRLTMSRATLVKGRW